MCYYPVAEYQNQQKSKCDEQCDDICQRMIIVKDVTLRTYDSQAPFGAVHGLVTHLTRCAVDDDSHATLVASSHLMTQGNEVGLFSWIHIVEDGMGEQFRRVRMYEVVALFAQHHKIGIRIGLLCSDVLREAYQ